VLVRFEARQKFEPRWFGPFTIVRVCPLGTYQLRDMKGIIKEDLVHGDRLKLAHSDSEPRKQWFKPRGRDLSEGGDNVVTSSSEKHQGGVSQATQPPLSQIRNNVSDLHNGIAPTPPLVNNPSNGGLSGGAPKRGTVIEIPRRG